MCPSLFHRSVCIIFPIAITASYVSFSILFSPSSHVFFPRLPFLYMCPSYFTSMCYFFPLSYLFSLLHVSFLLSFPLYSSHLSSLPSLYVSFLSPYRFTHVSPSTPSLLSVSVSSPLSSSTCVLSVSLPIHVSTCILFSLPLFSCCQFLFLSFISVLSPFLLPHVSLLLPPPSIRILFPSHVSSPYSPVEMYPSLPLFSCSQYPSPIILCVLSPYVPP